MELDCGEKPQKFYDGIIDVLREMTAIQCNDGNWNHDPYMHGMANGMIFALSLFQAKRPEYLEAPDIWCKDTDEHVLTFKVEETTT